jgi:hypothetical protein
MTPNLPQHLIHNIMKQSGNPWASAVNRSSRNALILKQSNLTNNNKNKYKNNFRNLRNSHSVHEMAKAALYLFRKYKMVPLFLLKHVQHPQRPTTAGVKRLATWGTVRPLKTARY